MPRPRLIKALFGQRSRRQVRELYSSTAIFNLALSAVNIFEPIFLFGIFSQQYHARESLAAVLWFYLLVYVIYFLIVPLGAKIALRFGYERTMALSTFVTVGFYLSLFGLSYYPALIGIAAVAYALSKMLYWPAYHGDFARYATDGQQGRQISFLMLVLSTVQIIGPLIGGLLIEHYGFAPLFAIASILIICSSLPMIVTAERFKPAHFSYFDAYRRLLTKTYRRSVLSYLGYGEELISVVVWPIYMFIIVKDFAGMGALVAVSVLVTTVTLLYVGRATDVSHGVIMRYGVALSVLSWVLRPLTRGVIGIFSLDLFGRVSKEAISVPITALTYERAQDTSVMQTVVVYEMSLIVGKIIAAFLALSILATTHADWWPLFLLGAGFTFLYSYFLTPSQRRPV